MILKYKERTWEIEIGCCPITLQFDHPKFGILKINEFQRPEKDCKQIFETKKIHYLGKDYILDRVWFAPKEQMKFDMDWYYFTIKE